MLLEKRTIKPYTVTLGFWENLYKVSIALDDDRPYESFYYKRKGNAVRCFNEYIEKINKWS